MTSEDYLKEKLQTVAEALCKISDIIDTTKGALPENVFSTILPDESGNTDFSTVLELADDLAIESLDILNALNHGILGESQGLPAMHQADTSESHLKNTMEDCTRRNLF